MNKLKIHIRFKIPIFLKDKRSQNYSLLKEIQLGVKTLLILNLWKNKQSIKFKSICNQIILNSCKN